MSNTIPLPEPYGRVTTHAVTGQHFFYRDPEPPYMDTAKQCIVVYSSDDIHAHAAAVCAERDARIKVLEDALRDMVIANERHSLLRVGDVLIAARAALGDKNG